MKFIVTICLTLLACAAFAQSPNKFSYQAVVRNSSNELVVSLPVGVKISLLLPVVPVSIIQRCESGSS